MTSRVGVDKLHAGMVWWNKTGVLVIQYSRDSCPCTCILWKICFLFQVIEVLGACCFDSYHCQLWDLG